MSLPTATFEIEDDPFAQFLDLDSTPGFIKEVSEKVAIQVITRDPEGQRTSFFHHFLHNFKAPYIQTRLRRHLSDNTEIRFLAPLAFTPHGCPAEGQYLGADHLNPDQVSQILANIDTLTEAATRCLVRRYLLGSNPEGDSKDIRQLLPGLFAQLFSRLRRPGLRVRHSENATSTFRHPQTVLRRVRKAVHRRRKVCFETVTIDPGEGQPIFPIQPTPMGSPENLDLDDYIGGADFDDHTSTPDRIRPDSGPTGRDTFYERGISLRELEQPLAELEPRPADSPVPPYSVQASERENRDLELERKDARLLQTFKLKGPVETGLGYERHRIGNHAFWPAGRVLVTDLRELRNRLEHHVIGSYILSADSAVASPDAGEPAGGSLTWAFPATHRVQTALVLPITPPTDSISGEPVTLRLVAWLQLQYQTQLGGALVLQDIELSEIHLAYH